MVRLTNWKILLGNSRTACLLVCALLSVAAHVPSSAKSDAAWISIADGRKAERGWEPTASELAFVKAAVFAKARKFWSEPDCLEGFQLLSKTTGAFMRKGSQEVAYLYSLCVTGHCHGINGIAMFEGKKLVLHVGYEDGCESEIERLPDINGDGLDEFYVDGGFTNMGITVSNVSVLGVSSKSLRKYGLLQTFSSNSGTGEPTLKKLAWRLFVMPGFRPAFASEEYSFARGDWRKQAGLKRCRLEPNTTDYLAI